MGLRERELRRINLVFIRNSEALVVDVIVRFKVSPDTLLSARTEMTQPYGPSKNLMARELGMREVQFYGFPVGARGLWPKDNDQLSKLGLSPARARSLARLVSRRALLYSLEV